MRIGYKLASEAFGPLELVRQAVRAEEVGFDFVEISDHYHPTVSSISSTANCPNRCGDWSVADHAS